MPRLTQYSRWHFLGGTVVFVESDKILTIIFYFVIPEVRFCNCPVNQLPTVRQNSFTQTQISHTRNQLHFRTINLSSRRPNHQQPRLLDCQPTTHMVSMTISFISFFCMLCWMVAGVRLLSLTAYHIINTSSLPHLTGISRTDPTSPCRLLAGFPTKRSL